MVVLLRPCSLSPYSTDLLNNLLLHFRTAFTEKQVIITPLNKEHHAAYHQSKVPVP